MFREITKTMEICDKKECTACGACVNVCPKQCITWEKDDYDTLYPCIDEVKCIKCNACIRTCHNNNSIHFNKPLHTYAAWSIDEDNRRTSASGGIASVFYKAVLENGGFTTGVEFTRKGGAHFIELNDFDDIKRVKNSKYVFSHTDDIFKRIRQELKTGRLVFFVGLPCQVAALKSYLGLLADSNNLLLADLLCHGIVNEDYLFQYLQDIERKVGTEADEVCFRDPDFGTEGYRFTLRVKRYPSSKRVSQRAREKNQIIYNQSHTDKNLYMMGYMDDLIFRDNCYQCHYARTERVGDLTFGDFDGLGKDAPCSYPKKKVSLLLVNTDKGRKTLENIKNNLYIEERSINEAVKYQSQLREPTKAHQIRPLFLERYKHYHNFSKAAYPCLKKELNSNIRLAKKNKIKTFIKWLVPDFVISMIRGCHS